MEGMRAPALQKDEGPSFQSIATLMFRVFDLS